MNTQHHASHTSTQAKKNVESGEVHKANEELMRLRQLLAREREDKEAALAALQSYQYDIQKQQVCLLSSTHLGCGVSECLFQGGGCLRCVYNVMGK
jgi:hypothetical protein